jgi:hypothetical protein
MVAGWLLDGWCIGGWKSYQESLEGRGEQERLLNKKEAEWAAEIRSARRTAPTQRGGRRWDARRVSVVDHTLQVHTVPEQCVPG